MTDDFDPSISRALPNLPGSELVCLAYFSAARRELREGELTHLAQRARERNASIGVTGVLVYCADSFFQILEGPAAAVLATYREKIAPDSRHSSIYIAVEQKIPERAFPDWSMTGCHLVDEQSILAYRNLRNVATVSSIRSGTAQPRADLAMLLSFLRTHEGRAF